jgi:hypothetical protein
MGKLLICDSWPLFLILLVFFGLLQVELLAAVCCFVEQLPRAGLLLAAIF